jgi:DNA-binding NarL/FixJ family response regulator
MNRPGFSRGSEVPLVSWSRVVGFSRHGRCLVSNLELDWCEHAKRGVAALEVVEDLEVLEGRVGELEVLHLLAAGKQNQEIAAELHMALNTVKKHATHIFHKLGATNCTEATVRAREFGLLP